jgi:hypothetical protein
MGRFLALTSADRRLLGETAVVEVLVAVALRVLSFRALRRALARTPPLREARITSRTSVARLEWAAAAVGRRLGRMDSCLARALTVQWLASRRGMDVPVRIGVRHSTQAFDAHAWISSSSTHAPIVVLTSCGGRVRPAKT